MDKQEIDQAIIFFLIHNQKQLKKACQYILDQRQMLIEIEAHEFYDDIDKQCKELLLTEINIQIAKELAIDSESIKIIIEPMDVFEYLK